MPAEAGSVMTDPMRASAAMIELRDVVLTYRTAGTAFTLLDIARLEIARGSTVGLWGPSGSGKTTVLNLLAGLMQPTSGSIIVDGIEVTALPQSARDEFRSTRIGYVFQAFNLIPALTALGNVEVAMRLAGILTAAERRARAEALLSRVGLAERMRHKPAQLSFGQMQRVGIARAIANRPKLILADEPTASLEPRLARSAAQLVLDVAHEENATLLLATHDDAILAMMDRRIALADINRVGSSVS